jgi:hypothetical protein
VNRAHIDLTNDEVKCNKIDNFYRAFCLACLAADIDMDHHIPQDRVTPEGLHSHDFIRRLSWAVPAAAASCMRPYTALYYTSI